MIQKLKLNSHIILIFFISLGLAFFGYLLFYRLGVHPFVDWDESIYAQVAKESFLSHRFFDFTFFEKAWYEKPPLMFWILSISYAIGGINEWSARVPSALFSLGAALLALRWVWEIRKSYLAVLLTLAAFCISFPYLTTPFFLNIDSVMAFLGLLSLYSWWKAKDDDRWYLVWGAAIGLGVMAKSIVGFFPLVPIGIDLLINREFNLLRKIKLWHGVLLGAIIILPWHIYQSLTVGMDFWSKYFLYHIWDRFATNLENNGAPFSFFFKIIFGLHPIATIVFGGAAAFSWLWIREDKTLRYIFISAAALFLLFSIPVTKLQPYIIMALPPLIMLAGLFMDKIIGYLPLKIARVPVGIVVALVFFYTGYQFNEYKIIQAESTMEYVDKKTIGVFLRDFHPELPVYSTQPAYPHLSTGFYSGRIIEYGPAPEPDGKYQRVLHTSSQEVYLGENSIIIR